jgi:putative ABC transport system permease protein
VYKAPSFAVVIVVILGLGIGVSTAVFSVVYAWLIDPYPYAKSSEIWGPAISNPKSPDGQYEFQLGDYLAIANLPAVSKAMATSFNSVLLRGDSSPEMITAPRVSASAFDFLGVPPVLGRGLAESDVRPNGEAAPVTVLSFLLWQRHFDADPGIVGRTIVLDNEVYTVVGVMPPRFGWYSEDGLWLPLATTDLKRTVRPIMRLKPGVSKQVAGQQLKALFLRIAKENPDRIKSEGLTATLWNYLDYTVVSGELRDSLRLLEYAVGCLLLIACTNVANLQLARGTTRSREIALRLAIGAGRGRIIRQLLTESVLLSLAGGVLGLALALGLTHLIVVMIPPYFLPNEARVTANSWVMAFTFVVSVATGILAALVPALQCTRPNLNDALKSGGQNATAGSLRTGIRSTLVVLEVALSVVLLVGAGLAARGFVEMSRLKPGYDPDHLLVLIVPLAKADYSTVSQRDAFIRQMLERLRTLPSVASATSGAPPHFAGETHYRIPGRPEVAGERTTLAFIGSDYLKTYRIPLLSGRDIELREVNEAAHVALITEAAAKLWPSGINPLGRTIELDQLTAPGDRSELLPAGAVKVVTIVGIIGDSRNYATTDPRNPPAPEVFVPYSLRPPQGSSFVVRTDGDPIALVKSVRAEVRALDKNLPLYRSFTVAEILGQQTAQPRFNAALFGGLGLSALALAAAGIYSVLSYNVSQRSREIGVRMALGAGHAAIQRLVLGTGMRLLGIGLLTGLALSVGLTRVIKSQVFIVPLADPLVLCAAASVLSVATLFACVVPARRASKVDPMVVLKAE